MGGLIGGTLGWRYIFWVMMAFAGTITVLTYLFLHETNASIILQGRRQKLQEQHPENDYEVEGVSDLSIPRKIAQNSTRAVKILVTQPIVTYGHREPAMR